MPEKSTTVLILLLFLLQSVDFCGCTPPVTGVTVYKPVGPSLLDFLGPWPWYLLSMELIGLVLVVLLYLPFAVRDWRSRAGQPPKEPFIEHIGGG